MQNVYRNAIPPYRSFVYEEDAVFPAKLGAWGARRAAMDFERERLVETPLWMPFHAGLWQEIQARTRRAAA